MIEMFSEPIVLGLILDVIGFILVFFFGGFHFGRSAFLFEDDRSKEVMPLKILGAILVIVGFVPQIYGNLK